MRRREADGGLRKEFRARFPGFHWISVETGGTASGIPDSNYASAGVEGWLEYKWTKAWRIGSLESTQTAWAARRVREGGLVTFAVRRLCAAGPRKAAADQLWLVDGSLGGRLRAEGLSEHPPTLAPVQHGGPSRWDWGRVRAVLLRGSDRQVRRLDGSDDT